MLHAPGCKQWVKSRPRQRLCEKTGQEPIQRRGEPRNPVWPGPRDLIAASRLRAENEIRLLPESLCEHPTSLPKSPSCSQQIADRRQNSRVGCSVCGWQRHTGTSDADCFPSRCCTRPCDGSAQPLSNRFQGDGPSCPTRPPGSKTSERVASTAYRPLLPRGRAITIQGIQLHLKLTRSA